MTVNRPSSEISPVSVSVFRRKASSTSSAPQMLHEMFVHTWTRYRPTGALLYIV